MSMEIYEVIEAGALAGFYNCYKLKLVAANWDATDGDKLAYADAEPALVSVMHVKEYGQSSSAERALAAGDRMLTWDYSDCRGTTRKIGVALTPEARMIKTNQGVVAANSNGNKIRGDMVAKDGTTICTTGLGHNVYVHCTVTLSSSLPTLSDADPRLESVYEGGDFIFAVWMSGLWECATLFNTGKECAEAEI